jgi:hypothetical protein
MKFNHPQPPILMLYCTISVSGLIVLPDLAQAQVPSRLLRPAAIVRPARLPTLNPIGATTALQEGATVKIFPGRASVINFRTDEFITSITLSDPTYVLYTPNAEIDSGQTTALTRISHKQKKDGVNKLRECNYHKTFSGLYL